MCPALDATDQPASTSKHGVAGEHGTISEHCANSEISYPTTIWELGTTGERSLCRCTFFPDTAFCGNRRRYC